MEKRHIALYNYLIDVGDKWTPQAKVARELYGYFGNRECVMNAELYHDTYERRILSKTITEINNNDTFTKIIISSSKGIKLANEKEFDRYIKSQYRAVFRKLKTVRKMDKKGKKHNQYEFVDSAINAFIDCGCE